MKILIAAVAQNRALGKDNKLLWHLPDDFKRFKRLTSGHHIIMGRKTFESLPRMLPNRTHIVVTRQKNYTTHADGCIVVHSIAEALSTADALSAADDVFFIGGAEIYASCLPFIDQIELTCIHDTFAEADTFFPDLDWSHWQMTQEEFHMPDEKHAHAFTFQTFTRI